MQITIRLKGFLKIALFAAIVIPCVLFVMYKGSSYVVYRIKRHMTQLEKNEFHYKVTIADTSRKGYILLSSTVPANKLLIMDLAGHIVLKKRISGLVNNFQQWKINGRTWYSYEMLDSVKARNKAILGSAGHVVIMDSALNEINKVHLLPYKDIMPGDYRDIDLHDFIMVGEGHYLIMSTYAKKVSNIPPALYPAPDVKIGAAIIEEIKDGTVVWEWDATDYPEFYSTSTTGNDFYDTTQMQDYLHINAMTIDQHDSNLIVSFRNASQLVKINRRTGGIIWRLGGKNSDFPLTAEQYFMRQHNPRFSTDGQSLLVFDNGAEKARPFSRILEFKLNEQAKKVVAFKAFRIPEQFSKVRGSVEKIGDDYLICGGSGNYILSVNSITGKKNIEILTNQPSLYRAYFVTDISGIKTIEKN